jgi:hypothetical protein
VSASPRTRLAQPLARSYAMADDCGGPSCGRHRAEEVRPESSPIPLPLRPTTGSSHPVRLELRDSLAAVARANRMLILCLMIGCVLIAVGLSVGMPSASVEGAYFDQVNGAAKFQGVFSASSPSLLDPADGNLWLGAGIVLIVVAACGAVRVRLRSGSTAPLPD